MRRTCGCDERLGVESFIVQYFFARDGEAPVSPEIYEDFLAISVPGRFPRGMQVKVVELEDRVASTLLYFPDVQA